MSLDTYHAIADPYQALIPQDNLDLAWTNNPHIGTLIRRHIAALTDIPRTFIAMDFAAGNGFDGLTLANKSGPFGGLFSKVYMNDASPQMISKMQQVFENASRNGGTFSDLEMTQGLMSDLPSSLPTMTGQIDIGVITHTLVQAQEDHNTQQDYRNYLHQNLSAVREMMSPNGLLIVDMRNWEQLVPELIEKDRHITFQTRAGCADYRWSLGTDFHEAEIRLAAENVAIENAPVAHVKYGHLPHTLMRQAFVTAGFRDGLYISARHGLANEPYYTFALAPA